MLPLSYHEEYAKKSFFDLIRPFGKFDSTNTLTLSKNFGEGKIQVIDIEDGLQIRLWDCNFLSNLEIDRKPVLNEKSRTFTIVYYLTPGAFCISEEIKTTEVINQFWNTVFMTSDAEFKVNILRNKPMKCLSLNFTLEWLQQNILCDIDFNNHFIGSNIESKKPFVLFESLTQNERDIISGLFENKFHSSFGKFFFRSKTLNLLTDFFMKIKKRESVYQGATLYHSEQVNEAAKKIDENINNSLPNIKSLAKELSISESTLKRYFKRIYGKNISAYFFEKKMEYAKELLSKKVGTVTDISYMLGYQKPSQFIKKFKQHYGIRPGNFKKETVLPSL